MLMEVGLDRPRSSESARLLLFVTRNSLPKVVSLSASVIERKYSPQSTTGSSSTASAPGATSTAILSATTVWTMSTSHDA